MELDFDKEIDALLRARSSPSFDVGTAGAVDEHLDADQLAAFADNSLPQRPRTAYTLHLADCDRCRKILSQYILLDEAAEEPMAAAPAPAVVENAVPWYRKLFLFPNLAYVMGGLVLIFGGFLGFQIINTTGGSATGEVTHVTDQDRSARGPNLGEEPTVYSSNFADATAANTNSSMITSPANAAVANPAASNRTSTVASANANAAVAQRSIENLPMESRSAEKNLALDAADTTGARVVGQPAPPSSPAAAAAAEADRPKVSTDNEFVLKQSPGAKKEVKTKAATSRQMSDAATLSAGTAPRKSTQLRRDQTAARGSAHNEASSNSRTISGKTFDLRQGAWYDRSYQGSATVNIRRGTEEYRKLESGLRSIAENLGGTVVVMWKAKAYRIQ